MPSNPEVFDKKRYYSYKELKLPSVTTILDLAYQKEWLKFWIAKKVAEEASRGVNLTQEELLAALEATRREASDHGDDIHSRLNQLGMGNASNFGPLDEWDRLYSPKILFTEAQVYNVSVGYAGTLDLVVEVCDKVYLVDLKTGSNLDSSIKLQLAAYRNAEFIADDNGVYEMPHVDACAILWIPRKTPEEWTFNEVSIGNRETQAFLACVDIANYQIANSHRNILGKQISYYG